MAQGRGGWLKQKWQEDHRFPDTRVFLLERKETEKWWGGERGQLMEREAEVMQRKGRQSERDDTNMTFDYMGCLEQSSAMDSLRTPAAFTQPHLSQSTLIRTIWLKDETPAINASSKDSSTVSPPLTLSNI